MMHGDIECKQVSIIVFGYAPRDLNGFLINDNLFFFLKAKCLSKKTDEQNKSHSTNYTNVR
jgi:hypothetical protein